MIRTPAREFTVPDSLAGERLDRAMAALTPGVSRGEARRLIAAGVVFVGGKRTGIVSRLLRAGERVTWDDPAPDRSGEATLDRSGDPSVVGSGGPVPRIVLARSDLWIIDKPAGMPVEATRAGTRGTLAEWLARTHGPAFVTHRLDAATSGLIVVARDQRAQAALNALFAEHAIGRRYLSVVAPPPPWTALTMDAPLDGRSAITHATVVARAPLAAALMVELETGRTRQIRRHLAGAGFPVIGETATGARTARRLLLHAFELRVPWPRPLHASSPKSSQSSSPRSSPRPSQRSTQASAIVATAPPPADFLTPAAALGFTMSDLVTGLAPEIDAGASSIAETDS